jgi:hypothetical protein
MYTLNSQCERLHITMCDDPIRLKLGMMYGGLLRAPRNSLSHSGESDTGNSCHLELRAFGPLG